MCPVVFYINLVDAGDIHGSLAENKICRSFATSLHQEPDREGAELENNIDNYLEGRRGSWPPAPHISCFAFSVL